MRIDRIFSKLYGAKLFSTFDLKCCYYYITIDENSRTYTEFTTKYGKYESLIAVMVNETLQEPEFVLHI